MTDRQKLAVYNTMLNAKLKQASVPKSVPGRSPDAITQYAHSQALLASQLYEDGLRTLRVRLGLPNTTTPGDWGVEQGIGREDGDWERFVRDEFGTETD